MPIERRSGTTIGELTGETAGPATAEGSKETSKAEEGKEDFVARVENQKEINELMELCFKGKFTLSCDDFGYIIDNIDSAMFLCPLSLLRGHLPTFEEFKRYESALNHTKGSSNDHLLSPKSGRRMAAARVLSKFAHASDGAPNKSSLSRSSSLANLASLKPAESEDSKAKDHPKSKFGGGKHPVASRAAEGTDSPIMPAVRLANAKQDSVDVTKSPSLALSAAVREEQLLFCQCGKQITDFNKLQCDGCLAKELGLKYEGCLLSRGRKNGRVKKMWYVIEKREMYCMYPDVNKDIGYVLQTDKKYKRMRSLAGCFVKEDGAEKFEEKTMYSFILFFANHIKKKYYAQTKAEYQQWCQVIKQLIGYSSLTDYYDVKVSRPEMATGDRRRSARESSAWSRPRSTAKLASAWP